MNRFPAFVAAVLVAVSSNACLAELVLTAEMLPLSGLDGLSSYRITATSDLGNVVGFDFSKVGNYGITGPLNQQTSFGQPSIFSNQIFGGVDASLDSQFLFNSSDVVSLFSEESSNSLHSAFALGGDRQLTIGNSVQFVQIATTSAQEVLLKGSLVVRRPNDEMIEQYVNVRLSDIQVGAAPHFEILPVPPPIVVVPPPVAVNPPVTPVVNPPFAPEVTTPNLPVVPPIVPPVPVNPIDPAKIPSPLIGPNNLVLTAEKTPISGMPGYSSFRITASSDLGNIVCFDFSKVGDYGIDGPINQLNPLGQSTIFRNQMFGDSDPLQDSQFLVSSEDVVQLFSEESAESLNAIFAIGADKQQTIGNSVPFVQIATADENNVSLKGSFAILRPDGQILETSVSVKLADILLGAAPTLDVLPVPPPPITEVITTPTVLPPATPAGTTEQTSTSPEQPVVPVGTEPQPPRPITPDSDQTVTIQPYPDNPVIVVPGEGVVTIWPVGEVTEFPATWFEAFPYNGTIDNMLIDENPNFPLRLAENFIYMTNYDGIAFDSDAVYPQLFVTNAVAYDAPSISAFDRTLSSVFGQQLDADQSRAEVPEPGVVITVLLAAAIATSSRPVGRCLLGL